MLHSDVMSLVSVALGGSFLINGMDNRFMSLIESVCEFRRSFASFPNLLISI